MEWGAGIVPAEPVTIQPYRTATDHHPADHGPAGGASWAVAAPTTTPARNTVGLSKALTVLLAVDAAAVLLADVLPVMSSVFALLFLATSIIFLVWLYRVRTNVAPDRPQRWSRGWTIGAWFVPVFNLLVPARIVWDIGRTDGRPNGSFGVLVGGWWSCWLLAWVTGVRYVNEVVAAQNGAVFANTGLFATLGDTLVSKIFTAAAAILLLVLVRRITNQQAPTVPR